MTLVHFHDVIAITLGPIRCFPPTASGDGPFWTLEITFKDAQGGRSQILVYANDRESLDFAPEERSLLPSIRTFDALSLVA